MSFQCLHCGQCCENVTTQINVTLGDILRLSEFLNKSVEELIPHYVAINPFGVPDSRHYELDLGLNIPCRFRENERCSVYDARPLNCRFFPFWIVARAPLEEVKQMVDRRNACVLEASFGKSDKERCRKYVNELSRIFHRESEITEAVVNELVPKRNIFLTNFKGYEELEKSLQVIADERRKEEKKIAWLVQHLPKHEGLAESINKHIKHLRAELTTLSKLVDVEKRAKPF